MAKIYQALSNIALVMNSEHHLTSVLDYETQRFDKLIKLAPAGDRFPSGTEMIVESCNEWILIFVTDFAHSDESISHYYITVRSDLTCQFTIDVTGDDREDSKEIIADVFTQYLMMDEPK